MEESTHISLEYYFKAFKIAKKHKNKNYAAIHYECGVDNNLRALKFAIDTRTWKIGNSTSFVVLKPKPREIFAGDFEKKVAETLLLIFLQPLIEKELIDRTYNCRKDKWISTCILQLRKDIYEATDGYKNADTWVLTGDIKSFFMSINKELAKGRLTKLLREKYSGSYLQDLVYILQTLLDYRPEVDCNIASPLRMWRLLPKNKSLFDNGEWTGLPIGDLLSQWSALYMLNDFGHIIDTMYRYVGIYADDFYIIGEHEELLNALSLLREILTSSGFELHPQKIYLQPWWHGVTFCGVTVKRDRLYVSRRTINNCYQYLRNSDKDSDIQFVQHLNSYLGYMSHCNSYGIRRKIGHAIDSKRWEHIYATKNFKSIKIKRNDKTNCKED